MFRLLSFVLASALAFAQTATQAPPSPPAPPTMNPPQIAGPGAASAAPQSAPKAELPPTAAVITIDGLCNGKVPAAPAPDCKTVITRAQFERLVDALDPRMPEPRRQQLADIYARLLVMSDAAEQRGLGQSADAKEVLQFSRMQTLTQLLLRQLQREAAQVPPAETEAYYNAHKQHYEQATLKRLFLPKVPPGGEKPPEPKVLQAEADKLRAAAAAGGDFDKLQKQAYDDLGIKTPPPPTSAGTLRRESLPPAQAKAFDLKPGEVSEAMDEPGGFYIFKLESKKLLTLPEVTPEINRVLEGERMKEHVEKLTRNVKPVLNEQYFGAAADGAGALPPGHPPTGAPRRPPGAAPPAKAKPPAK